MSSHLLADLEANKQRFVERVLKSKLVWGLHSNEGWAYCPSNHSDADVLLFWSDESYARRHAVKEWANYSATSIQLDSFIDNWLCGMHQDGVLAGVNFNGDLAGIEIEPIELAHALT